MRLEWDIVWLHVIEMKPDGNGVGITMRQCRRGEGESQGENREVSFLICSPLGGIPMLSVGMTKQSDEKRDCPSAAMTVRSNQDTTNVIGPYN